MGCLVSVRVRVPSGGLQIAEIDAAGAKSKNREQRQASQREGKMRFPPIPRSTGSVRSESTKQRQTNQKKTGKTARTSRNKITSLSIFDGFRDETGRQSSTTMDNTLKLGNQLRRYAGYPNPNLHRANRSILPATPASLRRSATQQPRAKIKSATNFFLQRDLVAGGSPRRTLMRLAFGHLAHCGSPTLPHLLQRPASQLYRAGRGHPLKLRQI